MKLKQQFQRKEIKMVTGNSKLSSNHKFGHSQEHLFHIQVTISILHLTQRQNHQRIQEYFLLLDIEGFLIQTALYPTYQFQNQL